MAASSTSAAPEVDRSRRFDLLPLYARGNPAMSTLATEVTKAVERRAAAEGRLPCLFSHERHLAESRKAVFQAIMQTRGGGVVLALLSPDFFQDCWCIAALLAALEVHGKAVSSEKLKLRFVCIEDELDAVREDELRKRLFPQLFEQSEVVGIARSANPVVMALCGADRVWDAWNGSATGTRPTALGGTVRHSFSGLSRALPPAAVAHLNFLSGDPRPESVADALEAALFKEVINLYYVDELEDIATRSFASQLQRDMLTAHADRWSGSDLWDWSMTTLNSLEQMQTTAHELMNAVQAVREPAADPRAAQPTRSTSARDTRAPDAMEAARSGGVDAVLLEANAAPPQSPVTYVSGIEDPQRPEHQIKAALTKSRAMARYVGPRVVVSGIGGSGKSTACKGVIEDEDVCRKYCGGIHWVQLSSSAGEDTIARAVVAAVVSLHRTNRAAQQSIAESLISAKSLNELCNLARQHIDVGTRKAAEQFLFVIDDVWYDEYLNAVVSVLPREASIIVTTRLPSAVECLSGTAPDRVYVSKMPENAAEELLRSVIGHKQAFSAVEKQELVKPIFEGTGCLPLALFIAGCMVETGGGAWKRVADVFREGGVLDESKVAMPGSRGEDQEGHKTIRGVIEASVRFMGDENTQNALLQLGVLPVNTVVKLDVVNKLWDEDVDTRGMADRLRRHGLVRACMNEEAGEMDGIELHAVIGAYALEELRRVGGERAAHERIVSGYQVQHGWGGEVWFGHDWFPMWDVADDGYLYDNIARHAEGAANAGVAGCVATQKWETARDRQRVGVAFKNDVEHAIRTLCAAFDGDKYTGDDAGEARGALCYDAGCAFYYRRYGDLRDNLEDSIMWLERSLEFCSRSVYPHLFARVSNVLGLSYDERISGYRNENTTHAIFHYEAALCHWTREDDPEEWAAVQHNLGLVYSDKLDGDRVASITHGIECLESALTVWTAEEHPWEWSLTQDNLGHAFLERGRLGDASDVEQAMEHLLTALTVRTVQAFPTRWAVTQNELGRTYLHRERGSREENVEEAISRFEHALTVRTREALPYYWALTTHNLGYAYSVRRHGEGSRNAARAVELFTEALTVLTQEAYPTNWASTTYSLMWVQYNRRNASAALECAVQLEAAPAATQRFSSDERDFVHRLIACGGQRSESDMSCSETDMSSAEAAVRTLCGFRLPSCFQA